MPQLQKVTVLKKLMEKQEYKKVSTEFKMELLEKLVTLLSQKEIFHPVYSKEKPSTSTDKRKKEPIDYEESPYWK